MRTPRTFLPHTYSRPSSLRCVVGTAAFAGMRAIAGIALLILAAAGCDDSSNGSRSTGRPPLFREG